MEMIDINWSDGINDNREPKNFVLEVGYDSIRKYYFHEKIQAEKYFKKYGEKYHIIMYEIIKKSW